MHGILNKKSMLFPVLSAELPEMFRLVETSLEVTYCVFVLLSPI